MLDEGKVKVDGEEAIVVVAKTVAAWKAAQMPVISLQTYTFAGVEHTHFDQHGELSKEAEIVQLYARQASEEDSKEGTEKLGKSAPQGPKIKKIGPAGAKKTKKKKI